MGTRERKKDKRSEGKTKQENFKLFGEKWVLFYLKWRKIIIQGNDEQQTNSIFGAPEI